MNHIQHTVPIVSVIIDMCLVDHSYNSKELKLDLSLIAGVSVAYIGTILYARFNDGTWVYAFLSVLSDVAICAFFLVSLLLSFLFYFSGKFVSSWLWMQAKKIKQK